MHSSAFALEEQPEKLNFQSFLHLRNPLVASFNETHALTSRKNAAEKGIIIPNLSETLRLPCLKSKKKECDRRDLNISDQFENHVVQPYTFWELEHDFYQKLVTGYSSIGKKNVMVYNF